MSTEYRTSSGELICIRWNAGEERGVCLDFHSRLEFEIYNNDQTLSQTMLFGSDGTRTTLWRLVRDTTGTIFLPNPKITYGEAPRNVEH
jgi:hypothetical protein